MGTSSGRSSRLCRLRALGCRHSLSFPDVLLQAPVVQGHHPVGHHCGVPGLPAACSPSVFLWLRSNLGGLRSSHVRVPPRRVRTLGCMFPCVLIMCCSNLGGPRPSSGRPALCHVRTLQDTFPPQVPCVLLQSRRPETRIRPTATVPAPGSLMHVSLWFPWCVAPISVI